jgi:hypothetical protein
VLWLDGFVLSVDYERGGYASRMRKLIEEEKEISKDQFREMSIRSSELNTFVAKNDGAHAE